MKKRINVKEKLICTLGLLAAMAIFWLLRIPCPVLELFGVPCPSCGMTRAYLSLLRLDIHRAFGYHPLFWTVPLLYVFFLFDGALFKRRWLNVTVLCVIGAMFVIWWGYSLYGVLFAESFG